MSKRYGLLIPEKNKVINRPSIFNDDSDSDDDSKPTGISLLKRQDQRAQEKAVAEDPTVYQYDELYDDMQSKRKESKLARKDLDKKPKYINKLLESAERRKRENERRLERQVQKEREEEGDEFKDKESFVTSGYRKKLEELKELEEKEKREEYLEAIGDVRKQSDLSGFYRHLYAQQVNSDDEQKESAPEPTSEPAPEPTIKPTEAKAGKKRKYRKRDSSKSDSEPEKGMKLEHLPSNIDADSDFAIDSSDSEDEPKAPNEPVVEEKEIKQEIVEVKVEPEEKTNGTVTETVPPETVEVKKPKIDIWKKRTVDDVFDAALKRYYERKAGIV